MPSVFWNTVSLRSFAERDDRLGVVEHVVAPDLVGAVGQPVRVLVVGRAQQELGAVGRAGRDDDDVGRVDLLRARRATTTPVTVRPVGSVSSCSDLGVDEQRDVRRVEERAHGDRLRVRLGVHQARVAVAPRAADARAAGAVRLVEQDAARSVERVVAAGRQRRRRSPGCAARATPPATGTACDQWPSVGSSPWLPCTW